MGGIQRGARDATTEGLTQHQQILKGHLRVVDTLSVLTVSNAMAWHLQRLTHSVEMKTNDPGC